MLLAYASHISTYVRDETCIQYMFPIVPPAIPAMTNLSTLNHSSRRICRSRHPIVSGYRKTSLPYQSKTIESSEALSLGAEMIGSSEAFPFLSCRVTVDPAPRRSGDIISRPLPPICKLLVAPWRCIFRFRLYS